MSRSDTALLSFFEGVAPARVVIRWRYGARLVKKLTKHGNSLALVIDRPILDLLKIEPDTSLDVSTDGTQLIVAPVRA
jgi:hypothetical protein